MKMEELMSPKAPPAIGPYCQGKKFGNMIITSGQLPLTTDGECIMEIEAATKQALENLLSIIEAGGGSKTSIAKIEVFMTDLNDFQKLNKAYAEFFGDYKPARLCIQVAGLPGGAPVEMTAIAFIED